jgi:hemerythrin
MIVCMDRMIRWVPDYAVGVPEIDEEHQGLFALAQKLQLATRAGKGSEILLPILDELVAYTAYHFEHEEELMQRIAYPYYEDHRLQHEDLRSIARAMRARSTPNELLHFLVDWLKCHTTTSDRRIGTYMRKRELIA